MPDLIEFKNMAIIQTAFIGDVALVLPLAQSVKNYNPGCQITLVTTPVSAPLVNTAKAVDKTIVFDKKDKNRGWRGIRSVAESLRQNGIDCVLSPHRSSRTSVIVKLASPKFSVGFDRNALSFIYKSKIAYRREAHEIDRNLSLLEVFSDFPEIQKHVTSIVDFEIDSPDKEYTEKLLFNKNIDTGKFIILAPGSEWYTKRWKEEYYIELVKLLSLEGYSCVLAGSAKEEPLCRFIAGNSGAVNLAGSTSLPQLLYLLTKACLLITNDSSPTHLAGIAGCPVITIFGPTVPEFGFAPRSKNSRIIQNDELHCRPCRIHGSRKCPVRTHECMISITPGMVFKYVQDLLAQKE